MRAVAVLAGILTVSVCLLPSPHRALPVQSDFTPWLVQSPAVVDWLAEAVDGLEEK